jgi:hypothetical protein
MLAELPDGRTREWSAAEYNDVASVSRDDVQRSQGLHETSSSLLP